MTTITIHRAVVEQALEALEWVQPSGTTGRGGIEARNKAITALRAALAQEQAERVDEYRKGFIAGQIDMRDRDGEQAEPVRPVAWMYTGVMSNGIEHGPHLIWKPESMDAMSASKGVKATPLYTAPPKAEPLPLKTVERLIYENTKINPNVADDRELLGYIVNAVRAVERAHGIGDNT